MTQIQTKFKQTEIGLIPEDWELVELGSLINISSSKRIFASEYIKTGIPFFRGKEIIELSKGNDISTELFISEDTYNEIKEKYGVPQIGDILLSSVGTLGVPYLISTDFKFYYKDGNITQLHSSKSDKINPKFLLYYVKSDNGKNEILGGSIGSTQQALTISSLKKVKTPLPPLPEQKAIAEILSSLDDKIELLEKQNKTLENIGQALFKSWFVDFEGFENDLVESEMGMIPRVWKVGKVGDLIEFINGYAFKSKELLDIENEKSYKVFKMGNIKKGGGFSPDKTKSYVNIENLKNIEKFILKKGDILMAMTDMKDAISLLGHTALMIYDNEFIVNQRVGLLRVNNNFGIDYPYLYLLTNSSDFIANLRGRSNSGVQVNLSTEAIKNSNILIAPKEINQKFNSITKTIFDKIENNQIQIQTLSNLRDSLLPRLMSGKIRVV